MRPLTALCALVIVAGMAASSEAQLYSGYTYREQVVVVPPTVTRGGWYDPWYGYDPFSVYVRRYSAVPQPSGHRITPLGPNGYIYEPIYNSPPTSTAQPLPTPGTIAAPGTTVASKPISASPAPAAMALSGVPPQLLAAFQAGKFNEVVDGCELLLLDQPRLGALQILQSHALFALGRYDEASGALRRGLSVLPEAQWSWLIGQRQQFYAAGAYDPLLVKLREHVAAQTQDVAAQLLLGYHLGMLGHSVEARQHLQQAATLDPAEEFAPRLLRRWSTN